jgi:exodeoxyribonuclease VII large subunit
MTQGYSFLPEGVNVRSVSQITEEIRLALERGLAYVWVEGEIVDVRNSAAGHIYVILRDASAKLKCFIFRSQVLRLPAGFEARVGMHVIAGGRIAVYPSGGEYQLVVERMFPKGLGAAELALRQLREKLQGKGYFDPRRKRKLPRFPRSICLVTSAAGAAVHDLVEILGRRWPATRVAVFPARVQGDGAAEQIAFAIQRVNHWKANGFVQVDTIIVGRGGGGAEDLAAFNHELVADAIFNSRIPVVSAVGHEVDVTIADLVADVRAATPSHAAELSVPDGQEVHDWLRSQDSQIRDSIQRLCDRLRHRLDSLAQRRVMQRPLERLRDYQRRLDDWGERMQRASHSRLERAQRELESVSARLESLSPLNVLARGYSLTRIEASRVLVHSADQVRTGDLLETHVQHGRILSRVEASEPTHAPP